MPTMTSIRAERRESIARITAAGVFVLASAITWSGARSMGTPMPMPGGWEMSMMWMAMPGQTVWGSAWMFLLMWQAMMIAMMLPSTWPMLELYGRVARSTGEKYPTLCLWVAAASYFAVWLGFGAIAFAAGFSISAAAMKSLRWSEWIPAGAGVGLILAGVFQISPWKQACLHHCRPALLHLADTWRRGIAGAVRTGVWHGAWCALCCWALMLIQMILGVMNLGVMIVIAALIGFEKFWKRGPLLARATGWASVAIGLYLVFLPRS